MRRLVLSMLVASFLSLACGSDNKSRTLPSPTQATVLVTSMNSQESQTNLDARTSQRVSSGLPTQTFDDFTLPSGGTVGSVAWQGIYCVQQPNAPAPAPSATGFFIAFYPDRGGAPDTQSQLSGTTYPIAQVNQSFDANAADLQCGTAPGTTWGLYRYSAPLATPFVANARTRYWISVQAVTPNYDIFWGWRNGTPVNNHSLQIFNGVTTIFNLDRAFSLSR